MTPQMTSQALALHPAPAAPAPAPSQIRFPRQPGKRPFSGFPHRSHHRAEMIFLTAMQGGDGNAAQTAPRQEYPTRLH